MKPRMLPWAVENEGTHNFNEEDLTAGWSHKSVAFVAGLGTFGVNRMLITPAGCAGRFGSMVISAEIPPTPAGQGVLPVLQRGSVPVLRQQLPHGGAESGWLGQANLLPAFAGSGRPIYRPGTVRCLRQVRFGTVRHGSRLMIGGNQAGFR
jgi:hypothetical protein